MKAQARLGEGEAIELEINETSDSRRFSVSLGGDGEREVVLQARSGCRWTLKIGNRIEDVLIVRRDGKTWVDWRDRSYPVEVFDLRERLAKQAKAAAAGTGLLKSQMPGKVIKVLKKEGEAVEAGDGLAVIEAMKMQNELKAPRAGTVKACNVEEGRNVEGGVVLFEIE